MNYETMTLQQLSQAREAIQIQKDCLEELDEKIIKELGKRAAERTHRDLDSLFGF